MEAEVMETIDRHIREYAEQSYQDISLTFYKGPIEIECEVSFFTNYHVSEGDYNIPPSYEWELDSVDITFENPNHEKYENEIKELIFKICK